MVSLSELRDIISLKIIESLGILNKKYPDIRVPELEYKGLYSGRININDTESVQFILKQLGDLNLCLFWFSNTEDLVGKPNHWFCIATISHIDDDNEIYCETSNSFFCHTNNELNKFYFVEPSDYELADLWRSFELLKLISPYWIKNEPTKIDLDAFNEFASKIKLEDADKDDNR